jgi:hypothetical protein
MIPVSDTPVICKHCGGTGTSSPDDFLFWLSVLALCRTVAEVSTEALNVGEPSFSGELDLLAERLEAHAFRMLGVTKTSTPNSGGKP